MFRYSLIVTVGAYSPRAHVSEKLFNNNINTEIECILGKFADDTKLSSVVDTTRKNGCHPKGPAEA